MNGGNQLLQVSSVACVCLHIHRTNTNTAKTFTSQFPTLLQRQYRNNSYIHFQHLSFSFSFSCFLYVTLIQRSSPTESRKGCKNQHLTRSFSYHSSNTQKNQNTHQTNFRLSPLTQCTCKGDSNLNRKCSNLERPPDLQEWCLTNLLVTGDCHRFPICILRAAEKNKRQELYSLKLTSCGGIV